MAVKQFLINLEEKILPGLAQQRKRKTEEEKQIQWYAEQKRRLEAGEEIEPPWISFPDSDPLALWVSWRYGNFWLDTVWKPFWNAMDENQQNAYLKKWRPPNDDWYQTVVVYWGKQTE
jgi:hypothetical protein